MIYAKCGKKSKIINEHAIKHDYAMNNKLAVYGDISVYLCDFLQTQNSILYINR